LARPDPELAISGSDASFPSNQVSLVGIETLAAHERDDAADCSAE
jgi:hypothetical protein